MRNGAEDQNNSATSKLSPPEHLCCKKNLCRLERVKAEVCVWTDTEALAGHRQIHAVAAGILVSRRLCALLAVELGTVQAVAFPAQRLMQEKKGCMLKHANHGKIV